MLPPWGLIRGELICKNDFFRWGLIRGGTYSEMGAYSRIYGTGMTSFLVLIGRFRVRFWEGPFCKQNGEGGKQFS